MKKNVSFEEGVRCTCCGKIAIKNDLQWLCQGCGERLITKREHGLVTVGENGEIVTLRVTSSFLGITKTYEVVKNNLKK